MSCAGSLIVFDMLSHQKTDDTNSDSAQGDSVLTDQPDGSGLREGEDVDNSMNELSEAVEEESQVVMDLEGALAHLGLTEFLPKFHEERIDMESLVSENCFVFLLLDCVIFRY